MNDNIFELIRKFSTGHLSDNGKGLPTHPQTPSEKDIKYLGTVLIRELLEMGRGDLKESIDTLCDLIIYMVDFGLRMGWNLPPYLFAIADANLRKKFPDGKYHHHASGKVIKPKGYVPADLQSILDDHIENGSFPVD